MQRTAEALEAFVFRREGVDYLKLCLDITLYFVGSVFDHVDGILRFYEQSLQLLKKDIVQYQTGTMSKPRRVKSDTFSILPLWLKQPRAKQDILMLRLDNSRSADDAADRALIMDAVEEDKAGALRVVLSADLISTSVSPFLEAAKALGRTLAFSSGHGGYSLNWNDVGDLNHDAKQQIPLLSRRYVGIDIPDLDGDLYVIKDGIKCVNWLTFLNSDYCDRVGGPQNLRNSLGKDIALHSLPNGLVIQAGSRPEIGDLNRRNRLPSYREVGAKLAPLRAKGHPAFIPSADEDATERWLARFDS